MRAVCPAVSAAFLTSIVAADATVAARLGQRDIARVTFPIVTKKGSVTRSNRP